jgi:hypothetical protein
MGEAGRKPQRAWVQVDSMTLHADCCYDAETDSTAFWIDGRCEFLLRRVDAPIIRAIYPNPASDYLTIDVSLPASSPEGGRLELFDSNGSLLRSATLETTTFEQSIRFDVGGLPPGQYTVRLVAGASIGSRTVILLR